MLKVPVVILAILFVAGVAYAQQPTQYSLYMFNQMNFNPAYAGLDNSLSATGVFRQQWVDFDNSPTSQNFNVHAPFYFLNSGLGFSLENDELGFERNLSLKGAYNYQLILGNTGILSIGVGGGLLQKTLDGSSLRTPDGDYTDGSIINHNDNLLPLSEVTASAPIIEFGVYFKNEIFEAGFSVRDIAQEPLAFDNFNIVPVTSYFFNAAAHLDLNRSLSLHPSVFFKTDVIQTQMDFSALVTYNDNISIGGSFRGYSANTIDAAAIIAGLNINENLRLFYSYDISLSELNIANTGSHEILINYNLNKAIGKGRPPQIIYNPRFL